MNNDTDNKKNKIQWWKMAVCALAVLVIAGAITYSLMTRAAASSSKPANTGSTPATATNSNAPANPNSAPATASNNIQASDGAGELNWVINLKSKWATYDFVFVVLPGNGDLTADADQVVKSASDKMEQNGLAVDTMTLSPTDPEFSATMERLAIQKLPAVLVFAANGQVVVVKDGISETKLLQAYLTIVKTCVPGSGCCGK